MMEHCPICNSPVIGYVGIDDRGGDYSSTLVDLWKCFDCEYRWEEPWIDPEDTQELRYPLIPEDKS